MGLCGVTARSTVFASTTGLVFQPGPHPCNPCVLPGMYWDPQNHLSLLEDAPAHLSWAEHIPAQWPRRASCPFLQTCCPTPLEGSRFTSTHHGFIALIARGFLVQAEG